MKYIVMECHEGYAILMDEQSRFVNAANLGYTVGQTVSEPVLMEYGDADRRRKRRIIMTVAAAAACFVIACGTGYHYYASNYKTYSTVIISSDAGVRLNLNKKGKVISLESTSPEGAEILSSYSGKGKDKNDAISEILKIGLSKGYFTDGDTVSLYVSENFEKFRNELEKNVDGLPLKPDVQPIEDYTKPAETQPVELPQETQKPDGPQPGTAESGTVQPVSPQTPDNTVTAPAVVPPPQEQEKQSTLPMPDKHDSADDKPAHETAAPEIPQSPTAAQPPEKTPEPEKPAISRPETPTLPDGELPHEKDGSDDRRHGNEDKPPQRPAGEHILMKPAPHLHEPEPEPEYIPEPGCEPETKPVPEPFADPADVPETDSPTP